MCLSKRVFLLFVILLFSLSVLCASKLVLLGEQTKDSDAFEYGLSYINVESEYFRFGVTYDLYSDKYIPMKNIVSFKVVYGSNKSSLTLIRIAPSKDFTKEYIEERIIEIINVLEDFVINPEGAILEIAHSGLVEITFGGYDLFSRSLYSKADYFANDIMIKIDGKVVYSAEF